MAAPSGSDASVNSQQGSVASGAGNNGSAGDKPSSSSSNNNLKSPAPVAATAAAGTNNKANAGQQQQKEPITHVSESAMDFLLTEVLHWVESNCKKNCQGTKFSTIGRKSNFSCGNIGGTIGTHGLFCWISIV